MNKKMLLKYVPLPDFNSFKTVLFVGPHPDDIEISSGALVKQMTKKGVQVHFLIATDGGAGSFDPKAKASDVIATRKIESENAARFLGATNLEILPFEDGGIYSLEDMTVAIAKKIIDIKPDAVFAPDPMLPTEVHPDHLNVGIAARNALTIARFPIVASRHGIDISNISQFPKGMSLIYFYTHRANVFIPVSEQEFADKITSIKYHASQIDHTMEMVMQYLQFKAMEYGKKVDSKFGEGYFALAPAHQHCFLENI
ncbi:MAG: PIG-L deacetylase family protein [Bacilli bacterium]